MKSIHKLLTQISLVVLLMVFSHRPVLGATTTVNLLTADPFAILAGSAVNDTNISSIIGNVGLSPAAWLTALTCAEVTGTIYSVDSSGPSCRVTDPALLTQAKNDLTTAYTDAGSRTPATVLAGGDNQLGGQTLTDGVYSFSGGAATANLIGTLTLDGQGDSDSVFIFQSSSDLVTASTSIVNLINGAQACNVFWYVPSSATFGTTSNFVGTVLADQSITDNGGSTINGRLLARIAAVTINDTALTKPTCTSSIVSSSTTTYSIPSISGPPYTPACPPFSYETPIIIESYRVSADSIYLSWGPYSGTDQFNVRYGVKNGEWLYNTDVTGFSTKIGELPSNTPTWVQVAARNYCSIGTYGPAIFAGGPKLPASGHTPYPANLKWYLISAVVVVAYLALKRRHE